jgi:hypothetical protein
MTVTVSKSSLHHLFIRSAFVSEKQQLEPLSLGHQQLQDLHEDVPATAASTLHADVLRFNKCLPIMSFHSQVINDFRATPYGGQQDRSQGGDQDRK